MEDVNSLLIGSISLVIILSLWVIIWIMIGKGSQTTNNSLISIRLFWLYIAITFTMVAITLSLIKVHFEGFGGLVVFENIPTIEICFSDRNHCTVGKHPNRIHL